MAAHKKKKKDRPREIRNSKVSRNYQIEDKYEAGIKLTGTEIKAIRAGQVQISDAFVRLEKGIPILYHVHINEYEFGNLNNHKPTRPRLLLLNKKEIRKLTVALDTGGLALIPTRMYFKQGLLKVEIALCRGKKLYDKREDLKKKAQLRDAERAINVASGAVRRGR